MIRAILFPLRWLIRDTKRRFTEIWEDAWHDRSPERSAFQLWYIFGGVLMMLLTGFLSQWWFPKPQLKPLPPEVHNAAVDCILDDNKQACAFWNQVKASYPVQK